MRSAIHYDDPVATHTIRLFGDPVLKRPAAPVEELDGSLAALVGAMYDTMYDAPGVGLAAPQVGCNSASSFTTSTTPLIPM